MQSKVLTVILAVVFVVLLVDRLAVPLEGTIICGIGNCFCIAYGVGCSCGFVEGPGYNGCLATCLIPFTPFPIVVGDGNICTY